MTIKQQGGIFGRNPAYNDVTVDNSLSVSGLSSLSIEDASTNTTSFPLELRHTTTGSATGGFGTGIKFFFENTTYSFVSEMATIEAVERSPAEIAGDLVFKTKWQNALAERASLKGRGGVSGVVDFNINAGNVIVANGYGIDFSATSGTGTSELFDDYEEGTFTATLTPSTSGTITLSGGFNQCSYVKIGSLVTVMGQLSVTSVASPVGYIELNLPFTCADLTDASGSAAGSIIVRLSASASGVNANDFGIIVLEGSATARIYLLDAREWQSDSAEAMQQYTNITLNLTYRTA